MGPQSIRLGDCSLATIGGSQREDSERSGCVIHKERGLRTDVVLFVLVQRVGRPGTLLLILIRSEPREPQLQLGIFRRNPGPLKNKGDQPCRVSVARRFLRRPIRALPSARQRRQAPATVSTLLFQKLANDGLLPIWFEQSGQLRGGPQEKDSINRDLHGKFAVQVLAQWPEAGLGFRRCPIVSWCDTNGDGGQGGSEVV